MRWKFLQVMSTLNDINNRLEGKLPSLTRAKLEKAKVEFENRKAKLEAEINTATKSAKEPKND